MKTPTLSTEPAALTHGCVRCGAPVALDIALCERCNPLGLPQPASTQAHGTVFLAIVVSVVGLALLGRFALSGIGPFSASIANVVAAPPGLAITISVTNEGASRGSATCRVYDPATDGSAEAVYLVSPQVEPGRTVSFSKETAILGSTVRPLAVDCGRP